MNGRNSQRQTVGFVVANRPVPEDDRLFYFRHDLVEVQVFCYSRGSSTLYDTIRMNEQFEIQRVIKCVNEVQKKLFIVGWMVFDAYYAIFEYDVLSATGRELRLNKLITSPITAAAVEFHLSGTPVLAFGHKDSSASVVPITNEDVHQVYTIDTIDGSAVTAVAQAQNPNEERLGWRDMRVLFGTEKGTLKAHRISYDLQVFPTELSYEAEPVLALDFLTIPETRSMVAAYSYTKKNETRSALRVIELFANGRRRILADLRPGDKTLGNVQTFRLTQGGGHWYRLEAIFKAKRRGRVVYHAVSWMIYAAKSMEVETDFKYKHESEHALSDICHTDSVHGRHYLLLAHDALVKLEIRRNRRLDSVAGQWIEYLDQIATAKGDSIRSSSTEHGLAMVESIHPEEEGEHFLEETLVEIYEEGGFEREEHEKEEEGHEKKYEKEVDLLNRHSDGASGQCIEYLDRITTTDVDSGESFSTEHSPEVVENVHPEEEGEQFLDETLIEVYEAEELEREEHGKEEKGEGRHGKKNEEEFDLQNRRSDSVAEHWGEYLDQIATTNVDSSESSSTEHSPEMVKNVHPEEEEEQFLDETLVEVYEKGGFEKEEYEKEEDIDNDLHQPSLNPLRVEDPQALPDSEQDKEWDQESFGDFNDYQYAEDGNAATNVESAGIKEDELEQTSDAGADGRIREITPVDDEKIESMESIRTGLYMKDEGAERLRSKYGTDIDSSDDDGSERYKILDYSDVEMHHLFSSSPTQAPLTIETDKVDENDADGDEERKYETEEESSDEAEAYNDDGDNNGYRTTLDDSDIEMHHKSSLSPIPTPVTIELDSVDEINDDAYKERFEYGSDKERSNEAEIDDGDKDNSNDGNGAEAVVREVVSTHAHMENAVVRPTINDSRSADSERNNTNGSITIEPTDEQRSSFVAITCKRPREDQDLSQYETRSAKSARISRDSDTTTIPASSLNRTQQSLDFHVHHDEQKAEVLPDGSNSRSTECSLEASVFEASFYTQGTSITDSQLHSEYDTKDNDIGGNTNSKRNANIEEPKHTDGQHQEVSIGIESSSAALERSSDRSSDGSYLRRIVDRFSAILSYFHLGESQDDDGDVDVQEADDVEENSELFIDLLLSECSKDSDVRTESPEPHEKMMKRFACKLNSMEQAILYYKIEEHVQQYKVLPHTEDQNTKLVVAYWLFDHNRIYDALDTLDQIYSLPLPYIRQIHELVHKKLGAKKFVDITIFHHWSARMGLLDTMRYLLANVSEVDAIQYMLSPAVAEQNRRLECINLILESVFRDNRKPSMRTMEALANINYTQQETTYILTYCMRSSNPTAGLFAMHYCFLKHRLEDAININNYLQSNFDGRVFGEDEQTLKYCSTLAELAAQQI